MSATLTLLSISGVLVAGVMSPGPNFVMVARTAVSSARANGVAIAFGMGIGGVVFATAALLGLHALLASVPWLYVVLRIVGGGYLIYLGYRILRRARSPVQISVHDGPHVLQPVEQSFMLGLVTQLSNPQTAVFYGSIFASLLPHDISWTLTVGIPLIVFCISAGWYTTVAVVLSSARPREVYLRYKRWVDYASGAVMVFLGLRLLMTLTYR